jgi:hypothetical protein
LIHCITAYIVGVSADFNVESRVSEQNAGYFASFSRALGFSEYSKHDIRDADHQAVNMRMKSADSLDVAASRDPKKHDSQPDNLRATSQLRRSACTSVDKQG